jgi:hypothetical protein
MIHDLKVWPMFFDALECNAKTFELRKHDRPFSVGDTLLLREWRPSTREYTGRSVTRIITYLMTNVTFPAIAPGYALMSIRPDVLPESKGATSIQLKELIRKLANNVRKESATRKYNRIDRFAEKLISPNVFKDFEKSSSLCV